MTADPHKVGLSSLVVSASSVKTGFVIQALW